MNLMPEKKDDILPETMVYAVRTKDKEVLQNSSSGGFFTPLSDYFLKQGGAVACSTYRYETQQMEFVLITNAGERNQARGSKYMQSNPGDIYFRCVTWLEENPKRKLLFVGTGCQAAGFQKFMQVKGLEKRTYAVDIICHGVPSPMLWRDYIQRMEKKYCGRSEGLTFKDKRNGWKRPTAVVNINGSEYSLKEYVEIFYNRCALRPSCHSCPYAAVERCTDLTMGDYWGIEKVLPDFYDPEGNSLVLIHTGKGKEIFDAVKAGLDYRESNTLDCLQPNLREPTAVSEGRDRFWRDYRKNGIHFIVKKYGTDTFLFKVKRKLKKFRKKYKCFGKK